MRVLPILLLTLSLAGAQTDYAREAYAARQAGLYWKAWNLYLAGVREHPEDASLRSSAQQFGPLVGQRAPVTHTSPKPPASLDGLRVVPALPEIVRRAGQTRVVILNEEHDKSQGRVFAQTVAQALRPLGYRVLAAETFSTTVYSLHEFPYPQTGSGFYTADPFFADFVRQAFAWGYRPIAYESTASSAGLSPEQSIQQREEEQTRNLVERVFKRYPADTKVLIYVGYAHASEKPQGELRWMAARLAEATGIDPLTIDQTTLSERDDPGQEHPVYRALRGSLKEPMTLLDPGGEPQVFGSYAGKVDLQVAHPPSDSPRPAWMRVGGYRREVRLLPQWRPTQGTGLLSAFVAGERESPVAMDRLAVTPESAEPLLLPAGRYRLSLETADGTLREVGQTEVP